MQQTVRELTERLRRFDRSASEKPVGRRGWFLSGGVVFGDRPAARDGRGLLVAAGVAGLLFATGIGAVPHAGVTSVFYDVVLFNVIPLLSAAVSLRAARRVPRERWAWWSIAATWLLSIVGNLCFPPGTGGAQPAGLAVVANACYLAAYPLVALAALVLVRVRVVRLRATSWLDGGIGALGVTAFAIAFVLDPLLQVHGRHPSAAALTFPVADVLLTALLVALMAFLGLQGDRILLPFSLAFVCKLVGDVALVHAQTSGSYLVGGPADLAWVAAALLAGTAAARTRPQVDSGPRLAAAAPRTEWRILAVPLATNAVSLIVLGARWGGSLDLSEVCALGCVAASFVRTAMTLHEVRVLHEARRQASTDELTGLPNRRALLAAAQEMLAAASEHRPAGLLLLDLDRFKEINDTLGHHAGDALLRQVGPRLRGALRPGDLLARLGGDEFAVLLPDIDLHAARRRAERLRDLLLQPFTVEGVRLTVGVSIGVSTAPLPANSVEELLRCADAAMYAAKTARGGVHAYQPDPRSGAGDRLQTMQELRRALTTGEIDVHLQPQLRLTDECVVGVEALVRWQHPVRGLLAPADLLPAAEQAGLLGPLADQVLHAALTAAAQWWPSHPVPVSVNLSAANVTDLDLPRKVAAALQAHGLPPAALTLELVEDTLAAHPDRGRAVLHDLRRLGLRTSIDDYGTGTGSLARLHTLPADELKLDRILTADVSRSPGAAATVRHTIALAHDLGLTVVAEGVEDADTAATLASLRCDVVQGYAVARPMPAGDLLRWLEQHPGAPATERDMGHGMGRGVEGISAR